MDGEEVSQQISIKAHLPKWRVIENGITLYEGCFLLYRSSSPGALPHTALTKIKDKFRPNVYNF